MALSAISIAYIGHTQGDPRFSQQGTRFYAQSLQHMRGQLMRNQIDEGMLAACICLSMFEVSRYFIMLLSHFSRLFRLWTER